MRAARYSSGGAHERLLVLDFDGVICDSVEECFRLVVDRLPRAVPRPAAAAAPAAARAEFRACGRSSDPARTSS